MSEIMDSTAFFEGRLKYLDLWEFVVKFRERGWTTMAAFGFSNSYVPGRVDDSVLVKKVFVPIFDREDHPKESSVRRLFYEAHACANADVERRMSQPNEEGKTPRKLPVEERGARWSSIQKELPLLDLVDELEPSNQLVDKCVEMAEHNEVRYIKWEEYTKRNQELKGVKKLPLWAEESGHLKRYYLEEELTYHAEDRLDLMYTLQRRGLAFQMGHLISFECHEKLVKFYFREMAREPVNPARFERVGISQVHDADQEIFTLMGEATRSGFRALGNIAAKVYPLDQPLKDAMANPRVVQILLPHPKAATKSDRSTEDKTEKKRSAAQSNKINQLESELKRLKSEKNNAGGGKGKHNSKSKGKGSNDGKGSGGKKTGSIPMPKELWGMSSEVNGHKVCFAYNMKVGCTTRGSDRCGRGHHLCCFPGCPSPSDHGLQSCPEYAKKVMTDKGFAKR